MIDDASSSACTVGTDIGTYSPAKLSSTAEGPDSREAGSVFLDFFRNLTSTPYFARVNLLKKGTSFAIDASDLWNLNVTIYR